jgi:hypothetical protein
MMKPARKIILADNRTSDLASYDNEALRDELRSLPDLEGTGYTQLDIDRLDGLFTDSSSRPTDENEPAAKSDDYWLEVGEFVGQLDRDTYLAWNSALVDVTGNKPASARKEVRTRLKIPMDAKPKVKEIGELISGQGEISIQEGSIEEIGTLIPYPHNVREGDVGAISVVLSEIGQYRPIVVNKLTREILVGNHTWFAASMLKWKEIAVVFVDVDEVIAKKIVLADNRTSDLATYDDEALLSMLLGVGDLRGTGFDRDDLDALADGASGKPMETTDKIRVRVGEYRMRVAPETFNTWKATLEAGNEMAEILERLQLPTSSLLSY